MEEKYYKIKYKDRPDGSVINTTVKARSKEEAEEKLRHQKYNPIEILSCVERGF